MIASQHAFQNRALFVWKGKAVGRSVYHTASQAGMGLGWNKSLHSAFNIAHVLVLGMCCPLLQNPNLICEIWLLANRIKDFIYSLAPAKMYVCAHLISFLWASQPNSETEDFKWNFQAKSCYKHSTFASFITADPSRITAEVYMCQKLHIL